ncbi:YgiQ family radical SAM protein [Desulfogranum marinum]|uniref:YgiQ family radical SAM protein n=1 Tax=Desulfogranum marinum TaxID=453220 RepID=UPI0029C8FF47|nr:YgiQ family radical SAM protein [Desulfogranum marinum]
MFLPTTQKELQQRGYHSLDVILITGDSYIDSPYIGAAVIGKVLVDAGFKVGIIAQPAIDTDKDIKRLGEPRLFWGITGGSVDSMVANYTATGRRRKKDDYTPGGLNNRRPDRAVLVYANLIRQHFKNTAPLVLGGIEASLRRVAHYDAWTNKIRKSILFDAKADYLLYGMAEQSVVALARSLQDQRTPHHINGLCYKSDTLPPEALALPPFSLCRESKSAFTEMFRIFYDNTDPVTATCIAQQQDNRFLVQTPPPLNLSTEELDVLHDLSYERELHPYYAQSGSVTALDTIRFAVTTHRGCYGECNFCAITMHQGRTVVSRSERSIIDEVVECTKHPAFKGIIADVGGPTANMYGIECKKKLLAGSCRDKRCIFPSSCPTMNINHAGQIALLKKLRALPGIKKIFIASGIRYDMILADKKNGRSYLREVIRHHISGQMKIAPEHCSNAVLKAMGKPDINSLVAFRTLFTSLNKQEKQKLFLTYYIIAAHPGCTRNDMEQLKKFSQQVLKIIPRQIQVFTPTPSTWSTLMYWTEKNPWTGKACFVEKNTAQKERQKMILLDAIKKTKKTLENTTSKKRKKGSKN